VRREARTEQDRMLDVDATARHQANPARLVLNHAVLKRRTWCAPGSQVLRERASSTRVRGTGSLEERGVRFSPAVSAQPFG
jgi:hypothetical protein